MFIKFRVRIVTLLMLNKLVDNWKHEEITLIGISLFFL